jgi:hypothetical protein
MELENGGMGW